jgi:trimeric autotransporter adhesin
MPSNPNPLCARWRTWALPCSLCAVAVLLSACGGGADNSVTPVVTPGVPPVQPVLVAVSGVVADGPLKDATVCYDLNNNNACDTGEPGAVTNADGQYTFNIDETVAGRHSVLASVPATAVDKDTGQPVGVAFQLKSPATGSAGAQAVFVSPLTTVVADLVQDGGKTVAEAVAEIQATLGLSVSPMTDFTVAGAAGADEVGLAARAVGAIVIETSKLVISGNVDAVSAARLIKEATGSQLAVLASTLAASTATTPAAKAAEAAAAVAGQLNLKAETIKAVAEQLSKPAGTADLPGPFVSVRRFAYTDANNYSYVLFSGDNSTLDADGRPTMCARPWRPAPTCRTTATSATGPAPSGRPARCSGRWSPPSPARPPRRRPASIAAGRGPRARWPPKTSPARRCARW